MYPFDAIQARAATINPATATTACQSLDLMTICCVEDSDGADGAVGADGCGGRSRQPVGRHEGVIASLIGR